MDIDLIPLITGLEIIEDRETESDSDSIGGESIAEQEGVLPQAPVVKKRGGKKLMY